jgi:hypothetical protein
MSTMNIQGECASLNCRFSFRFRLKLFLLLADIFFCKGRFPFNTESISTGLTVLNPVHIELDVEYTQLLNCNFSFLSFLSQ